MFLTVYSIYGVIFFKLGHCKPGMKIKRYVARKEGAQWHCLCIEPRVLCYVPALSCSETFEWHKHFDEGHKSVNDNPSQGGSEPIAVVPVNFQ